MLHDGVNTARCGKFILLTYIVPIAYVNLKNVIVELVYEKLYLSLLNS